MIRLSKSVIGPEEKKAVLDVLDEEYLGMGKWVQSFEQNLEIFFGAPVVCVATGTAAIQLAVEALGVGLGDEVLVPSLTYVASFQAISATGATPVACDIDEKSLCLCPKDAAEKITNKTKAVLFVHYAGNTGTFSDIIKLCEKKGLKLIEDAAHAMGTQHEGKLIGLIGDVTCFSFDGIKNITSGEGGCIVSRNEDVIEYVKDARLLGVSKDTDQRYAGQRSWDFDVKTQGWRYHMSNIMAAIGIEQLKKFTAFKTSRQDFAKYYREQLGKIEDVIVLDIDYDKVVPHIFVIRVKSQRNKLRDYLLENDIQTGIHYKPNHLLTKFKSEASLPVVEKVYDQILTLPLHPDLTKMDIDLVVQKIEQFYAGK